MSRLTPEQVVALANQHLDIMTEAVRDRIESDPTYSIHQLVERLMTRDPEDRIEDHLCTLAYNLALALFRFASAEKESP